MTQNSATAILPYSVEIIMQRIIDAENLPKWNPAFSDVGPVNEKGEYPITVQKLLRGTMSYTQFREVDSNSQTIELEIKIPGLSEQSEFILEPMGQRTKVTHHIIQTGPLTAVIGASEAAAVPNKRLTRLKQILDGTY